MKRILLIVFFLFILMYNICISSEESIKLLITKDLSKDKFDLIFLEFDQLYNPLNPTIKIVLRQDFSVLLDKIHKSDLDFSDEFRLGFMLSWTEIICNSDTELLQNFFWGDISVYLKKNGRVFAMIDPKLKIDITIIDPRHDKSYGKYPQTDSFYEGIILGKIVASHLIRQAELEISSSIIMKNNIPFILDQRSKKQKLIPLVVAKEKFLNCEKQIRYQEVPSFKVLLFLKENITRCACPKDLK